MIREEKGEKLTVPNLREVHSTSQTYRWTPRCFLEAILPEQKILKNEKGGSKKEPPFFLPQGRGGPPIAWPELRQIIAERGEHHVVDSLRPDARCARPTTLRNVGVLEAPPNSALRTLVHLMPKANGPFLN